MRLYGVQGVGVGALEVALRLGEGIVAACDGVWVWVVDVVAAGVDVVDSMIRAAEPRGRGSGVDKLMVLPVETCDVVRSGHGTRATHGRKLRRHGSCIVTLHSA